jgi:hypothetical protein
VNIYGNRTAKRQNKMGIGNGPPFSSAYLQYDNPKYAISQNFKKSDSDFAVFFSLNKQMKMGGHFIYPFSFAYLMKKKITFLS